MIGDFRDCTDIVRTAGANVHPSAELWCSDPAAISIGADVVIGAGSCVVADAVRIDDGVVIGTQCDIRAGSVQIGARTEVQSNVRILVAERFEIGKAGRIEQSVVITCRSFISGLLLYLGTQTTIGYGGTKSSTATLTMGDRVALGPHCIINCDHPIQLDDDVGCGSFVSFWTHGYHFGHRIVDGHDVSYEPVRIGEKAWLAYHVTVLPGTSVGARSIIAAGAVVINDIPADVLAAGVPAKVRRKIEIEAPADDVVLKRIAGILDDWTNELRWKGIEVEQQAHGVLVSDTHRITLGQSFETPDSKRVEVLVALDAISVEPGDRQAVFELRPGVHRGFSDALVQDLRDFLRRRSLPCGDDECFSSIEPEPFRRLAEVGSST